MATEIPMQVKFHQILALTFPGFFSAVTFFMLIDLWSPLNLTSYVFGETSRIIAFIGLVFVIGTMFGIINDGINHLIIEGVFFDRSQKIIKIKACIRHAVKDYYLNILHKRLTCANEIMSCETCAHNNNCNLNELILNDYYIFSKDITKYISIDAHLNEEYYCYCSFYSNSFISLVFFAVVSPSYFHGSFGIGWGQALLLCAITLILSGLGLYSSFNTYIYYYRALYSIIRGYVDTQDI